MTFTSSTISTSNAPQKITAHEIARPSRYETAYSNMAKPGKMRKPSRNPSIKGAVSTSNMMYKSPP